MKNRDINRDRDVIVNWTGPHKIEEIRAMNDDPDAGLYQVNGTHIVFGKDSLLYIGQTVDYYSKRFNAHWKEWLSEVEQSTIYLGRIDSSCYRDEPSSDYPDWQKLVRDTEALTIWWHSPPYNSKNLQHHGLSYVLNVENRGCNSEQRLKRTYSSRDHLAKPVE